MSAITTISHNTTWAQKPTVIAHIKGNPVSYDTLPGIRYFNSTAPESTTRTRYQGSLLDCCNNAAQAQSSSRVTKRHKDNTGAHNSY